MTIWKLIGVGKDKVVEWGKTTLQEIAEWFENLSEYDRIALLQMVATAIVIIGLSIGCGLLIYDNVGVKEWKVITGEIKSCVYHPPYVTHYKSSTTHHPAYYYIEAKVRINKQLYYVERNQSVPTEVGTYVDVKYGYTPLSHKIRVTWR